MSYIFSYGSLMQGFWNYDRYLHGKAKLIGEGSMGGNLYHLPEGYPALLQGKGTVWGEVMKLLYPSTIDVLDRLEGYYPEVITTCITENCMM